VALSFLTENLTRGLHCVIIRRVELCRSTGRTLKSFSFAECDGGAGQEFRGVPRLQLLKALQAALPADAVQFGAGVSNINSGSGGSSGGAVVELEGGRKLSCGLLVGADGARSAVGSWLGVPQANYAGYVAYRWVVPGRELWCGADDARLVLCAGCVSMAYLCT
jgi:2-polyprenyl-6-methoxyphenol hydroxylase-like FAD-dependent oxidoreductase